MMKTPNPRNPKATKRKRRKLVKRRKRVRKTKIKNKMKKKERRVKARTKNELHQIIYSNFNQNIMSKYLGLSCNILKYWYYRNIQGRLLCGMLE